MGNLPRVLPAGLRRRARPFVVGWSRGSSPRSSGWGGRGGRDGPGLQPGRRHGAGGRGRTRSTTPWPPWPAAGLPSTVIGAVVAGPTGVRYPVSGADDFPELRAHLLEHSVRRGDFVLKSGRRSSWFIDSKQTVCRPEAMVLVADAVLSVIPPEATAIGGPDHGGRPGGLRHGRGGGHPGPAAQGLQRAQGGEGPRRRRSHRRRARSGRQGGGDRGHRDPRHLVARGGPGRAGGRRRADPAGGRGRSRGHGRRPWRRPRGWPSGPSSPRPIWASTTKGPERQFTDVGIAGPTNRRPQPRASSA